MEDNATSRKSRNDRFLPPNWPLSLGGKLGHVHKSVAPFTIGLRKRKLPMTTSGQWSQDFAVLGLITGKLVNRTKIFFQNVLLQLLYRYFDPAAKVSFHIS